nr:MAG TPA: hypothetical protein [Caudoviricetes sp.]
MVVLSIDSGGGYFDLVGRPVPPIGRDMYLVFAFSDFWKRATT